MELVLQLILVAAAVFGLFALALLYLAPSIIAVKREHPHRRAIVIVNIVGGVLLGLGWLVALIWAMMPIKPGADTADAGGEKAEKR